MRNINRRIHDSLNYLICITADKRPFERSRALLVIHTCTHSHEHTPGKYRLTAHLGTNTKKKHISIKIYLKSLTLAESPYTLIRTSFRTYPSLKRWFGKLKRQRVWFDQLLFPDLKTFQRRKQKKTRFC